MCYGQNVIKGLAIQSLGLLRPRYSRYKLTSKHIRKDYRSRLTQASQKMYYKDSKTLLEERIREQTQRTVNITFIHFQAKCVPESLEHYELEGCRGAIPQQIDGTCEEQVRSPVIRCLSLQVSARTSENQVRAPSHHHFHLGCHYLTVFSRCMKCRIKQQSPPRDRLIMCRYNTVSVRRTWAKEWRWLVVPATWEAKI